MHCGAEYATSAPVKFNKNNSLMFYFKADNPLIPGSSPGGPTNYTKRLVEVRLTAFFVYVFFARD